MPQPIIPLIFVAIAVIFLAAALRDYLTAEGKLSPARKTWIRVAVIFAGVAIGLYIVQVVFR
jgi:hypothetical protein